MYRSHSKTIGHVDLDEKRLAGSMNVFVSVMLAKQSKKGIARFEEEIALVPEVMSCILMTGER